MELRPLHCFRKDMLFLEKCGGLHDCPRGDAFCSMSSNTSSYTSNEAARELLHCVATAVRVEWASRLAASETIAVLADESTDVSAVVRAACPCGLNLTTPRTGTERQQVAELHSLPHL
jgi:hypothetical protein